MRTTIRTAAKPFLDFWRWEAASSILLLAAALLAIAIANSPWGAAYAHLLHAPLSIGIAPYALTMSLTHWVNDGLMAIFFFVVGLEIKREFLYGELKSPSAMLMPVCAALGGMLVPAALYALVNFDAPSLSGWGIPMATDIAFALGVMTLVARSAPLGLVVFLTALAIVDDLGAILVIAIAYSAGVHAIPLGLSILAILAAFLLGRFHVRALLPYLLLGLAAWGALLASGIHPTIAGVALGLAIPAEEDEARSMLHHLEEKLEPWSSFAIMPVFALANAGVALSADGISLASPILLGILLGLCAGKAAGIAGAVLLLHKLAGAPLPGGATVKELLGAGLLGGIGFTMSIFIASIAFSSEADLNHAKSAILLASTLSAALGAACFALASRERQA